MAKRRWNDLSPRTRRSIVVVGTVEGLLKAAALVDLARRPAEGVRGSKRAWATAIVLVSSAGVLPVVYFRVGRRTSGARTGMDLPQP